MKILICHNFYQQPGGEDVGFRTDIELLENYGHDVYTYTDHNERIEQMNPIKVAADTFWSTTTSSKLEKRIAKINPDVVHFHNTFPLISPSAYYVCQQKKVPVIQSLHNSRVLCQGSFFRDGSICQDCLNKKIQWDGILHGCYRKSRLQTSVVALMIGFHHLLKTWQQQVDTYIVFTEFYKKIFIKGGLPADKIRVMEQCIYSDPKIRKQYNGEYALYIGRLDTEKGAEVLISAWKQLPGIPLKIRGSGQLLNKTKEIIASCNLSNIQIVDRLPEDAIIRLIKNARFLIWPSLGFYETFGRVAVEAFACGVPVIASKTGVNEHIVKNNFTGLHFKSNDPQDLAAKVTWAWEHPEEMVEMGKNARKEFEAKYTAEKNYEMLMDIYQTTIDRKKKSRTKINSKIEL